MSQEECNSILKKQTLITRKIKLTIDVELNVIHLIIDPAKLKQILYNYISNALKFTNEGGSINIRVKPEGVNFFRLEVEDNGIGIRKDEIPKLFKEFQQLDSSFDKKYQGTGLGLALTKRIAEALGGYVDVKSCLNQACRHFLRNLPGHPSLRKGQKKTTSMPPAALAVLVPLDFDPPSGLKIYAPQ